MAGLCLGESRFVQIRLHLHEEVRSERLLAGQDLKVYLRDRLRRCLHAAFETVPWFYVAIEDRDTDGLNTVRPHLHGAIQIPRVTLASINDGRTRAAFQRRVAKVGVTEAEYFFGHLAIRRILKQASGNDGSRSPIVGGVSQGNNTWMRKPYHLRRHHAWVSYALKNMNVVSSELSQNRLSISRELLQEAQRLWELIRVGEAAIEQWPL